MSLAVAAVDALEPYIGRTVADTCIRATALSIGKTYDTLEVEDLPTLEANIRHLMSPIAPAATVDAIIVAMIRGSE